MDSDDKPSSLSEYNFNLDRGSDALSSEDESAPVRQRSSSSLSEKGLHAETHNRLPSCPKHKNEITNQYCLVHDAIICKLCYRTDHKRCSVDPISRKAKGIKTSTELEETKLSILQLLINVNDIKANLDKCLEVLEHKKKTALREIQLLSSKITNLLSKLENKIRKELLDTYHEEHHNLLTQTERCREIVNVVEENWNELENTDSVDEVQLFVSMHKSIDNMSLCSSMVESFSDVSHLEELKFECDEKVKVFLRDLQSFGQIIKMEKAPVRGLKKTFGPQTFVNDICNFDPTFLYEINARHPGDKRKCYISGLVALKDGRLVLVDRNNRNLKLTNTHHLIVSVYALTAEPWDVAELPDDNVVVSTPNHVFQLQMFDTRGKLTPGKKINVGCLLDGVTFFKGYGQTQGHMVVTCPISAPNSSSVKFLTLDGLCVRNIVRRGDGKEMFIRPHCITVSEDTLYVSDSGAGRVAILTEGGQLLATPRGGRLQKPYGITVGRNGDLYVCCIGSRAVFLITRGQHMPKPVIEQEDEQHRPCSICYMKDKHRLIVGFLETDTLKMYQLLG